MKYKKLPFRKYLMGTDTFSRHLCLAMLISNQKPNDILDVGGEGTLEMFVNAKITSINIRNADVIYGGKNLPFKDVSFDMVVSSDTLEHVQKSDRLQFCQELNRVSRKGIVLNAPLGTDEHIAYERMLLKDPTISTINKTYLEEHVNLGLPLPQEVERYKSALNASMLYQGDYQTIQKHKNWYISLASCFFSNLLSHFSSRFISPFHTDPTPNTNRFFLFTNQ